MSRFFSWTMSSAPAASELIGQIYRQDDPVQSFLNAYTVASASWNPQLFNLLAAHESEYGTLADEFDQLLRDEAPDWQVNAAITLASHPLVAVAAILRALDLQIATRYHGNLSRQPQPYRSSDAFGGLEYWLAADETGSLAGAITRFPRDNDHLQATLRWYHQHVLVTPAAFGGWRLFRVPRNILLEKWCRERVLNRSFRIAVSPICREAEIKGESHARLPPNPPHGFYLTSVGPPEAQKAALLGVLERAYENRVAILVLPELRMPPALLETLRGFLREQELDLERGLLLVAAGSWHVEEDGARYNRCTVLNHLGETLWTHDKLIEFLIAAENYQAAPDLCKRIGVGEEGGCEAIQRGLALRFYDSSLGRIAAAICVGYFSPEVEPLLQASGADLFLVPAMTPSMSRIEERANALVETQLAFTFSANCGVVGAQAPSMLRWPKARSKAHWLAGDKLLAVLEFNDLSAYDVD